MKTRLKVTLGAHLALAALPGCWSVPQDDAGDEAFAVWASVAILGRRPSTHAEVEAMARLADTQGRDALVDVLLEQPEFVDYWGSVLLEDLLIGPGNNSPDDLSCYTDHKLATSQYDELVHHLTYKSWTTEFCPTATGPVVSANLVESTDTSLLGEWDALAREGQEGIGAALERLSSARSNERAGAPLPVEVSGPDCLDASGRVPLTAPGALPGRDDRLAPSCESFTMADAVSASLTEDRLDVLFRVGLVPLAVNHDQDDATANLFKGWIDRDPGCVACHTTRYSATDALPLNDNWDRFETASWVDLEGTVFTYTDGDGEHYGGAGGGVAYDNVHGFFRPDAFLLANGRNPFGMDASCVTATGRAGFDATLPSDTDHRVGFAGVNGTTYGPMKLVDEFALGVAALYDPDLANPAPYPAPAQPVPNPLASCDGCHFPGNTGGAPADLAAHVRYMSPWRIEDIVANGSPAGGMIGMGVDLAQSATWELISQPGYVGPRMYEDRHAGFAHLVAMSVANNIFEEMSGSTLDIEHDFPRNSDQAEVLEELTRELVDKQWSLKAVVRRIALSDLVNRRAPLDTPHEAYELPMVVAPWADVIGEHPDPVDGEDLNGQGDLVHRWSIQNLLWQVHHAMMWPAPPVIPTNGYVDATFIKEVGAFSDLNNPGFHDVLLPAMLAWEGEVASCTEVQGDYIDQLVAAPDLTLEQAMLALKDRLVSDGQWWSSAPGADIGDILNEPVVWENTLVEDALTVSLDDPASANEIPLRQFCAALLQSPQFLLAGLPPWPEGDAPLDADPEIPCVDDRCDFVEHCEYYRDEASALGYGEMSCE